MAEDASVAFTIVQEGACQGRSDKKFTLKRGAANAFRIGRAPGNDLVVEFRGVSQYHAELRLESVGGQLRLCVRDLSMNGTGLQKPDAKVPVHLTKLADEPVQHDSIILVPMLLKANADTSSRALLRVQFDDPSEADGLGAAPAEAAANGKDGAGSGEEDDVEKNRMEFVDLLLKTKEVSAQTTFEDARALLEKEAAWHAVDEETRKECFDIFVEHLGSHSSKKKDKKKKDKGKEKKKKEEEKEEPKKGRRKGSRSGSEGKARKGKKKGGSDDGSRSRSRSPGDKRRKRRRGHSSD